MGNVSWILAHAGGIGWDEIALFLVPIVAVAALVAGFELQRRRK